MEGDVKPFYLRRKLFLKPFALLNISIQFPTLKYSGQSISTKTISERLEEWAAPDKFSSLKVVKSTLEFIRFEGEIENFGKHQSVLNRLDGRLLKIPSFAEELKVRASVAKYDFPSKRDWDSFFQEAKNMNEMKAGERPDTIHIQNLPCEWFALRSNPKIPNENILFKVFTQFGEIRALDIPSLDPYRNEIESKISGINLFSFSNISTFQLFVQFKEYMAFIKAMDALRGMKLMKKDGDKTEIADIKVDFDRTKHLSDISIRRRLLMREKLIAKIKENAEVEIIPDPVPNSSKEVEKEMKLDKEKGREKRRKEREDRRKAKALRKLQKQQAQVVSTRIAEEEKLLLLAQRKLESIRLLGELLKRIKDEKEKVLREKEIIKMDKTNYQGTRKSAVVVVKKPSIYEPKIKSAVLSTSVKSGITTSIGLKSSTGPTKEKSLLTGQSKEKTKSKEKKLKLKLDSDCISVSSYEEDWDNKTPLVVHRPSDIGSPERSWGGTKNSKHRRWSVGGRQRGTGRHWDYPYSDKTFYVYYRYFKSITKTGQGSEMSYDRSRSHSNNWLDSPKRGSKEGKSPSYKSSLKSKKKEENGRSRLPNDKMKTSKEMKSAHTKAGSSRRSRSVDTWSRSSTRSWSRSPFRYDSQMKRKKLTKYESENKKKRKNEWPLI